jgi:phosphoribosylanthranilate isomerase
MRVKICGITTPEQGNAIAALGATALGFMCVPTSPRYVIPQRIRTIIEQLPAALPDLIGVFVDASVQEIYQTVEVAGFTGVQLHGGEAPAFCEQLRQALPTVEIIKALRMKTLESLNQIKHYQAVVDTLLLDAYHPGQYGGTGQVLDWQQLQDFHSPLPWFLAGGLNPDNVLVALSQLQPDGIDLSSGVEYSPGNKNLEEVARLFETLRSRQIEPLR